MRYVSLFSGVEAASVVWGPLGWERLMGFEDGYTDVPYRGKDHPPDTPRYRALGNSMCVNVMRWIGTRLMEVDERHDQ